MKQIFACFLITLAFLLNGCTSSENAVMISAGDSHSMAIKSDNSLWVWGENTFGQLGNGKQTIYEHSDIIENNDLHTPAKIMDNIIFIAAGRFFSMAINSKNELFTWGQNDRGQLGNGETTQSNIPVKIMDDVIYVNAYSSTAIAIKKDNTLWMWGNDIRIFQIGRNNNYLTTPVMIMENIKKAVLANSSLIILDNENRLYGIGNVSYLGINDTERNKSVSTPQFIMDNIIDISACRQTIYALDNNSQLFGWGVHGFRAFDGTGGYLGNDSNESWIYSPVLITDDVKKIFSGYMFLKNDDSLWINGSISGAFYYRTTTDGQGQYTGGEIMDSTMIVYGNVPFFLMDNALLASGSGFHNMAVDKNGNLYTWGNNQFGELGNGKAAVYEIKYSNIFTGEETKPGEGESWPTIIQSNNVLVPTIIDNLFVK